MLKKKLLLVLTVLSLAVCVTACGEKREDPERGASSHRSNDDDDEDDRHSDDDDDEEDASKDEEKDSKDNDDSQFEGRANATEGIGTPVVLSEGDVAPDFTMNLVGGGTFTLSDYDDEIVLLNFFATWCGPCVGEMPAFEMLKEDGDAVIVSVNCGESKKDVNDFVDDNGYTYMIGYDTDYVIEEYYPTDGIPYTLVINKGIIEKIFIGAYGADEMYEEYSEAIADCE